MVIRKKMTLLMLLFILSSCSISKTETKPLGMLKDHNVILFSDGYNVQTIDLDTNKSELMHNKIYLQSFQYDKEKARVVAPGYSPEKPFLGLIYTNNSSIKKQSTAPFSPVHLYSYKSQYVMDSAQALKEDNVDITRLGVFNSDTNSMVKLLQVPGIVKDITGTGQKAYISSYYSLQGAQYAGFPPKSNIYELDMNSLELQPIYPADQQLVPFRLLCLDGYLYGIYQRARNVPPEAVQDQLVQIDPKTGHAVQTVQLAPYAKDLVLSSDQKSLFITHFDEWGSQTKIQTPISKVDLSTFRVETLSASFRAASMASVHNKLYVGSEMDKSITVIDEASFQIDKTIPTEITVNYLTSNQ